MTKELTVRSTAVMNFDDFEAAQRFAKVAVASQLFPDSKGPLEQQVAQATIKIMAGQELGMGPFEAMRDLFIIDGKVAMGAGAVGARIKSHPDYNYEIVEWTHESCELRFFYKGEPLEPTSIFDVGDATKAGKLPHNNPKSAWNAYRRNMLFARALTNGARIHCPEVFGGSVYTPEELKGVVREGIDSNAIEVEAIEVVETEKLPEKTPLEDDDIPDFDEKEEAEEPTSDMYFDEKDVKGTWQNMELKFGTKKGTPLWSEELNLKHLRTHLTKHGDKYSKPEKQALEICINERAHEFAKQQVAEIHAKQAAGEPIVVPEDDVEEAVDEVFGDDIEDKKTVTLKELGATKFPGEEGSYQAAGKTLAEVSPEYTSKLLGKYREKLPAEFVEAADSYLHMLTRP